MALGFGLIGCGRMGWELGMTIQGKVDGTEIVAAFDPYGPNLRRFCAESGAEAAGSLEEMLGRDDVGAVIVASPNDLHCEQTLAAAAAGKHVFCEKPMALLLSDCDRMVASCEEAGVKLMVGHSMRLYPLVRRLLEVVSAGGLGEPIYGFASYFFSGFRPRQSEVWHVNRERSGGLFFHMAVHHIDLFLAVFGRARRAQYAGGRYGEQVRDFDDVGTALVEFSSGATGVLTASSLTPAPWRELVFLFSQGFARMDTPWSHMDYGPDDQHVTRVEAQQMAGPSAVEAELSSFTRWVLYDERPVLTAREGRAAVAVAEAVRLAGVRGGAVEVEE